MNLSIASKLGIFAVTSFALLAACDTTPAPDITAPKVASTAPANGSTPAKTVGKISVTFDEAMDTSVTTGIIAFTLPTTGAPAITAPTWSADKKTLSVTIPTLAATTNYKFNVTALAKDTAGNKFAPLTAGYSFTTAADGPVTGAQPTADVAANINGFYKPDTAALVGPTNLAGLRVGYTVDGTGAPDGVAKAFFSFNLPAGLTTAKIKKATLKLVSNPNVAEGTTGDGSALLGIGNVRIESVVYAGATLGAADFTSAGTSPVNIAALTGFASIDVTTAVKADVTGSRAKSQFRASLVEPAARPTKGAFMRLGSTTAPAANQPSLVIEYNP